MAIEQNEDLTLDDVLTDLVTVKELVETGTEDVKQKLDDLEAKIDELAGDMAQIKLALDTLVRLT